jgi:hypothetical protein
MTGKALSIAVVVACLATAALALAPTAGAAAADAVPGATYVGAEGARHSDIQFTVSADGASIAEVKQTSWNAGGTCLGEYWVHHTQPIPIVENVESWEGANFEAPLDEYGWLWLVGGFESNGDAWAVVVCEWSPNSYALTASGS